MRAAATTARQVLADAGVPFIEIQLRVQADADIAEVVMRRADTGFRHRHLGAQHRRVVAELA